MDHLFTDIAIITGCSALLAWAAAMLRQPIIVGYVLCGILLGPWCFGAVVDTNLIHGIGQIGVTLLLFMAGLVLHPHRLMQLFRKTAALTILGGLLSAAVIFLVLLPFSYGLQNTLIAAAALTFSSTILITKLLPTTTLHQRHMGSLAIAVLIAQDLAAVVVIVLLSSPTSINPAQFIPILLLKVVLLTTAAIVLEQFLLRKMMRKSDRFHEVLILLCLGWCLVLAAAAELIGLTHEVGAFLAGIAVARSKISLVLSEALKPVRDFFLVLFFFALGAQLDLSVAKTIWFPALLLTLAILISRPWIYRWILRLLGENKTFSAEVGARLGQASEFALIIAFAAVLQGKLSEEVGQLIQLTAISTMVISAYFVVSRYPTPIGTKPGLQRD